MSKINFKSLIALILVVVVAIKILQILVPDEELLIMLAGPIIGYIWPFSILISEEYETK